MKYPEHHSELLLRKLLSCIRDGDVTSLNRILTVIPPGYVNIYDRFFKATPMTFAVRLNRIAIIEALILADADLDAPDNFGRTPLMWAAREGNPAILRRLISLGANVQVFDVDHNNVLFHCMFPTNGHIECLHSIMKTNVCIDNQNIIGETALISACNDALSNAHVICELLPKSSNLNLNTTKKRTALLEACASGSAMVVAQLIKHGADITMKDDHDRGPAHEAARGGHLDVLFTLSGFGAELDMVDKDGKSPLHLAASIDANCCKFLLQRGCNPNLKDNEKKLPRIIARESRNRAAIRIIKKYEGNKAGKLTETESEFVKLYDWSIAHYADLVNKFREVEETPPATVIEQNEQQEPSSDVAPMPDSTEANDPGTEMNKEQNDSPSSTIITAEIFKEILQDFGAPCDERTLRQIALNYSKSNQDEVDWRGFLTGKKYVKKLYLQSAFEKRTGRPKKVKAVRKRKNPLPICTKERQSIPKRRDNGISLNFIPKKENYTDEIRFKPDSPPQHPLQDDSFWYLEPQETKYVNFHAAARYNDSVSIKAAVAKGYNVDAQDEHYKTPLMHAARTGNLSLATTLIKLGAQVNARDNFYWTPLHHAAYSGMTDVVELLLNNGAEINARAINGATPLNRAIECSKLRTVEYLIEKGAELTLECRNAKNVHDVAKIWADQDVVELVHDHWELTEKLAEESNAKKKKSKKKGKEPFLLDQSSIKISTPVDETSIPNEMSAPTRKPPKQSKLLEMFGTLEKVDRKQDARTYRTNEWIQTPGEEEQVKMKRIDHERFGWDHGLPDVPDQQIAKRILLVSEAVDKQSD